MKNYKKFLCAFLAVLLLSLTFCPFCLADGEYETEVELQPFMPPIGEIIVDDTLEGTSSYPMAAALTSSNSVIEDSGNTALMINSWNSVPLVSKDNFINSDKLVVSFDMKATGTSFADAVSGSAFDLTKRSATHFGIRFGGSGEDGAVLSLSSNKNPNVEKETLNLWVSAGKGGNTAGSEIPVVQNNAERDGYVNFTAVFEKRANGVYVTALYANGESIITDKLKTGCTAAANWWSADGGAKVLLQNRTGKPLYNYYDNILIYAPAKFAVTSVEPDADNMGARVVFNYAIDKTNLPNFTLTDDDGAYACKADRGANSKEIHISFDKAIDLNEKNYYLDIDYVKASAGDILEDARIYLGKEYVGKLDASAVKSADEITVSIDAEAKCDDEVYAVATAFSGDSIVDFKLEKVTLSTSGTNSFSLSLNGEDVSNADRVQVFLIDSAENMRIVSSIETPEL